MKKLKTSFTRKGRKFGINERLIERQQCQDNVPLILDLHKERLKVEELLNVDEADDFLIEELYKSWVEIQFKLQDAWKFERNAHFHRPWDIEGCTCPKMDNDDMYPTGRVIMNTECKIHKHLLKHGDNDGMEQ